ncbi:MAG: hypothetical protein HQL25_05895 [Candidatus Omnitrophica bacterium]|nr:hypothetical protein [Candidatus Omnitrophota bacterium]
MQTNRKWNYNHGFKLATLVLKNMIKNTHAFTLLELMLIVIVIGTLASIALPQYGMLVEKSKIQNAIINIRALQKAQIAHRQAQDLPTFSNNISDLDIDPPKLSSDLGYSLSPVNPCATIQTTGSPKYPYILQVDCDTGILTCSGGSPDGWTFCNSLKL